jgi:hypothetical protein
MDWAQIVRIEPALAELLKEIEAVKDDLARPAFCASATWVDQVKPRLCQLVGWGARDSRLRSMQAYEAACEVLRAPLPPCRGCACDLARIPDGRE